MFYIMTAENVAPVNKKINTVVFGLALIITLLMHNSLIKQAQFNFPKYALQVPNLYLINHYNNVLHRTMVGQRHTPIHYRCTIYTQQSKLELQLYTVTVYNII